MTARTFCRLVGQVHNSPGARAQSSEEQFSQDAWGPADLVPDYYKVSFWLSFCWARVPP